MAKATFKAAEVLKEVGGFLYGEDRIARLASILGVPPKVVNDTLRGHGGLTEKRLLDIAESRAAECDMLRALLRERLKFKRKK